MSNYTLPIGNPQTPQTYATISPLDLPSSKVLVIRASKQAEISPETSSNVMQRMWLEVLGFELPATVLDSDEPTNLPFDGPEIDPDTVKAIAALPYSISVSSSSGTVLKVDTRDVAPQIKEIVGKLLAKCDRSKFSLDFELPFGTKVLIGGGVLTAVIVGGVLLKRHMDAQP